MYIAVYIHTQGNEYEQLLWPNNSKVNAVKVQGKLLDHVRAPFLQG